MLSLHDVPFPGPERWVGGLVEGRRGTLVQQKRERAVWRVDEDGRTWFVKRGVGAKAAEVAREVLAGERLARAGLPVATLVAAGRHAGAYWMVTEPAPGATLDAALRAALGAGDAVRARRLLGAAAALAARLHGRGFRFPDLTAGHVFVDEAAAPDVRTTLIDVARAAAPLGGVRASQRAEDLAALLFSLPLGVGTAQRTRLLREALGARGAALRPLARDVDAALRRLALRTRWRHAHADAHPELLAALTALCGAPPRDLYATLLDPPGLEIVRTLPDRENRRFRGPDGRTWFMKLYPPVAAGWSPALRERRAIARLARAGVPVCRLAAYGEDRARGSFVVVRGCDGEPLDDLLRTGSVTQPERRVLARDLGALFRRLHRAGLRHRDAYACHVFAARRARGAGGDPRFELRLIDLTRAGRAPPPRARWYVKDVAQLWHGVPREHVHATDVVRFLRAYAGVPRLDAAAKRFARRVAAKERRIRAREERHAARRGG